jgi:hypothetical protein
MRFNKMDETMSRLYARLLIFIWPVHNGRAADEESSLKSSEPSQVS